MNQQQPSTRLLDTQIASCEDSRGRPAVALVPPVSQARCLDCIAYSLALGGMNALLVRVDHGSLGHSAQPTLCILPMSPVDTDSAPHRCPTCVQKKVHILQLTQESELQIETLKLNLDSHPLSPAPGRENRPDIRSATTMRPDKRQVIAVIPAYNEDRYIGSVVLKTLQFADRVVVVDDGSSDKTAKVAAAAGAKLLRHEQNCGKGAALNTGFRVARQLGASAVVLLDGDGQHRPEDIPAMVRPVLAGEADMVVGSRYLEAESEIPSYRRAGQHTVTLLTNLASGVTSTDSWSGFRAFSARAIEHIRFNESGWGVDPELQFQARALDMKVAEVPIVALYEEKAKRNPIPHGLKTINAILRLTGQHRPLLFMGGLGLAFTLAGILIGVRVAVIFQTSKELALGTTVVAALLITLGVIVSNTGIVLHSIRALLLDIDQRRRENDGREQVDRAP